MHSTPSLPLDRCGSSVENRPVDLSGPPSPTPHHLTTPPVLFLSSHEPRGTRLVFRAVNLRRAGRQRVASWTTSKTQFAISRRAEKKNTGPLPPLPPSLYPSFSSVPPGIGNTLSIGICRAIRSPSLAIRPAA